MTPTTRCIVLLSACSLWGACVEKESALSQPRPHAAASAPEVAALEAQFKPAALETLTASAAAPIKTVADTIAAPAVPAPRAREETALIDDHSDTLNFDRSLSAREVVIERFVLASDVKGREPVGVSDTFSTDTKKIFAFVQLANKREPYAVVVHWEPIAGPPSRYGVALDVPTAERFRTWSWTAIRRDPGRYRAVLRTREGEEIASRELLLTASPED